MDHDKAVRKHLLWLLHGGEAHMTFDEMVKNFPLKHINTDPPNSSYTPWRLLEHIRISQWDILEFIKNPDYVYLKWPEDYWPDSKKKATESDWKKTVRNFKRDLEELSEIIKNPVTDLHKPLAHGEGQTIFREILLVADHNAYHIGEFAILREVMATWPNNR
ncbi:DinB family protein [Candidatus Roizmanbacteria bacterium]|nr:DinB family protein [Candidatus Roizmanbacteria bacterium]